MEVNTVCNLHILQLYNVHIPKDLAKLCNSYLSDSELIYYSGETNWTKFQKDIVCNIAAENGWIDLLKWARKPEKNCHWDYLTCSYAALNGHLLTLKWARENGCDWDSTTCGSAAYNGHLEVLKWARENGCEWNSNTSSYAALN